MKLALPCPVCNSITYSNKCEKCGHEFLPDTPKPVKIEPEDRKPQGKKPKKFLKS